MFSKQNTSDVIARLSVCFLAMEDFNVFSGSLLDPARLTRHSAGEIFYVSRIILTRLSVS